MQEKILKLAIATLLATGSLSVQAQVERSDEFHGKYKLSEVVVFSRHNVRAPLASNGDGITLMTPYEWHDFGVKASELTMRGGLLETTNGQFFNKWVVSEGLFPRNAEPTDDEIYVLANSKQRTISTARHFISAFMPMKTITVNHEGKVGDMDPNFSLTLGYDITDEEWAQIKEEYDAAYSPEKIRQVGERLKPNFDLLADVLDLEDSEAYQTGDITGFDHYDGVITYEPGAEPNIAETSISKAYAASDALVLQYYEEADSIKAAFGKDLTREQWHMLGEFVAIRDEMRFASPFVQRYVSRHQRNIIASELQKEGRKFTFLCGHDTNLHNILCSMRAEEHEVANAVETGTPIGSKIVFEKWTDESGNAFIGVNHVYQSVDQLRNRIPLDLNTRPCIVPLTFEGLTANEDGLYPLDDIINRLTEQDLPSGINSHKTEQFATVDTAYTISGTPATDAYQGVVIQGGAKRLVK